MVMWIGIIFGVIALFAIWDWINTTINTKNVIEYYPNGRTRLSGTAQFSKRIGVFELFNDEGKLNCNLYYSKGTIVKEEYINSENGKVWKETEIKHNVPKTISSIRRL